jgi:hypothetical protein
MNPPRDAPAIPNRIVKINPPESGPGVTNLATTPTINPNTIYSMIDMTAPPYASGDTYYA